MKKISLSMLAALVLLAGCGRQHKAEGTVKDFISANARADYDILHIGSLDSTTNVTDSMIGVMHRHAEADRHWAKGISYSADYHYGQKRPLYFVPINYVIGGDTLRGAFYLSADFSRVAGFI